MVDKNTFFKKAGILSGVMVVFVALIVINANLNVEPTKEEVWQKVYRWTPLGAEGNPGAGASGFLEIFFINISTATSGGYGLNTSSTFETWATANMPGKTPYGNADEFEWDTESEKTFVILVRVRYNQTHAWETDHWNGADTDVQLTMTCTDWAVGSNINNVSGTRIESANNSAYTFLYENFYWDNSGTGYQIADDSTWAVTEIYIEARF